MRQKTLVTICGAAIAGSLFLPWVSLPAPLGNLVPWDLLRQGVPQVRDFDWQGMLELPPLLLTYMATFVLGALCAVLAVIGWAPRALALITSLLPLGLAGYIWLSGRDKVEALGVPVPVGSIGDVANAVTEIAGIGFYLWGGAAILLLIVALLDPGDRY